MKEEVWKSGRELLIKVGRIAPTEGQRLCPICFMISDKRSHKIFNLRDYIIKSNENLRIERLNSFWTNCFQLVGMGIRHLCTRTSAVQNAKNLVLSKDEKMSEQITSTVLKFLVKNEKSLQLSTGGSLLPVVLKQKLQKNKVVSTVTIFDIKKNHDLLKNVVRDTLRDLQKELGRLVV
ncbi:uncharacterized protein LOC136084373 [Hydra vulgaris]|uniref:Uncharacterized protein LOC136084373 n=1 Tax=Hydra vulgaris TaxID=6087 RepID=A0ABM4CFG6_HYDVU